jgi:hypothetical protein
MIPKLDYSKMRFRHLEPARPLETPGPARPICTREEKKFQVEKRVNGRPVFKTLKSGPRKGQTVPESIQIALVSHEVHGHGVTYRATSKSTQITVLPKVGKPYKWSIARFRREAARLFGDRADAAILHLASASPMLTAAQQICPARAGSPPRRRRIPPPRDPATFFSWPPVRPARECGIPGGRAIPSGPYVRARRET